MYFNGLRILVAGVGVDAPIGTFAAGQLMQYDGATNTLQGGPTFSGTYAADDVPSMGGAGALVPRQRSVRRIVLNQTSNSTSYANIADLDTTINRTGFLTFDYFVLYQSSGVGEGIGLQVNFTGTANGINYAIDMFTDAATRAPLVTAGSFGSGIAPQAVGPGAVDVAAYVKGSCNVTATGVLSLQFRAETGGANNVSARIGTWGHVFAL